MTTIAVSVGCPCGIGPEVSVSAAATVARERAKDAIVLVGDRPSIELSAVLLHIDLKKLPNVSILEASALKERERVPGKPGIPAGRAQLAAIDMALDRVLDGSADALVTGPVSKSAITATGTTFTGHTEHVQQRTRSGPVVMAFIGPNMRVALVTTHLPISALSAAITRDRVVSAIGITARALWRDFAVEAPRVAVCGLNPHAGEGGLLGSEELETIGPAIGDARELLAGLATIDGPIPAESAMRRARDGDFDVALAMFHDQATIASKLVDFGDAVNVTLGLPIIRTSVDHGTAYDIAYMGRADARGMKAAMNLAFAMAVRRRAP